MTIAYFKCICTSQQRLLAKKLRDDGVEVRDIRKSVEWRKAAKALGVKMPFIVENGLIREL